MTTAKKGSSRASARKVTLASFLRKLWRSRGLLARFSASREGRAEVLRQFNLSARHKRLLTEGCVRDIIAELAGVTAQAAETTVVNVQNAAADVACGHPECKAFMKAVVPARAKKKKR